MQLTVSLPAGNYAISSTLNKIQVMTVSELNLKKFLAEEDFEICSGDSMLRNEHKIQVQDKDCILILSSDENKSSEGVIKTLHIGYNGVAL